VKSKLFNREGEGKYDFKIQNEILVIEKRLGKLIMVHKSG
jgi:hypothetical protein